MSLYLEEDACQSYNNKHVKYKIEYEPTLYFQKMNKDNNMENITPPLIGTVQKRKQRYLFDLLLLRIQNRLNLFSVVTPCIRIAYIVLTVTFVH
jgi:hypothetical protein